MKNEKLIRFALVVFGIVGIGIGIALLFTPVSFEASAKINLGSNPNLLSEIRAYGALILTGGITIMLGAIKEKLIHISVVVSTLFYLSLGFSRILSMIIDGIPSTAIISATVTELIIGFISLLILRHIRVKSN